MSEKADVWTAEEMKRRYGALYRMSAKVPLDRRKVPRKFWPLLPYAEFWGILDDGEREKLVDQAPREVQENLADVVAMFDSSLDDWLAGPEADEPEQSAEYLAF